MFERIFTKFPGLHSDMLSESFSRYIREFRKPCGLKRADIISKLNKKLQYSQIHPQNLSNNPLRKVILNLQSNNSNFKNAPLLKRSNSKSVVTEK